MGNLFPQPCSPHYLQNLRNFPPSHPIIITPLPSNRNFFESIPAFGVKIAFLKSFDRFENNEKNKLLTVQNFRPKRDFLPKSVINNLYNL